MKHIVDYIKEVKQNNIEHPNGFCLLKPEFLSHNEEFLKLLNDNGWEVVKSEEKQLTHDIAAELYKSHKGKDYYDKLCDYMSSDKCFAVSCNKACDDPIKDMDALKDKIRKDWGKDELRNAMHSSDSLANVKRETNIFFNGI